MDPALDFHTYQVADSLQGMVLWVVLRNILELHMVIHDWARLRAQGR